jgi:hypothetical protein
MYREFNAHDPIAVMTSSTESSSSAANFIEWTVVVTIFRKVIESGWFQQQHRATGKQHLGFTFIQTVCLIVKSSSFQKHSINIHTVFWFFCHFLRHHAKVK